MEILIKCLNSTGLMLDILGAWLVYKYVFNKPDPLKVQASLPSTSKTEIINGVERVTLSTGVALDLRAYNLNNFNKYKEKLFIRRARFGFYCLVIGFLVQIISNFGNFLSEVSIKSILSIVLLFVLSSLIYLFVYLLNISEVSPSAGNKFTGEMMATEKGSGVTINTDSDFQEWSRKVDKYSKRIKS